MSTDYQAIYRDRAEDYDRLVSAEDADDHLGPALAYYQWLEKTQGMTRTWVRTDYAFADAATASELTGFFFGPELAARASQSLRLPECTGLWWRR